VNARWVPFDVARAHENPFVQFDLWFEQARDEVREPEAIALITANAQGAPSARMVLLRHRSARSFGFFTNYESRKGTELAENPQASLLWYVEALGRQVRIEGIVSKLDESTSDAYFASRPRGHQIGAHASHQSHLLRSRGELEDRVAALTESFEGSDVPRPAYWGGYELIPERFEFWQHREDRLHDRVVYLREGAQWRRTRLSP
jgi:pyridoxamine 5'-phosphate oxidase